MEAFRPPAFMENRLLQLATPTITELPSTDNLQQYLYLNDADINAQRH